MLDLKKNNKYDFVYYICYKHLEKLWGKGKDIVRLNTIAALTFSMFSLICALLIFCYILSENQDFLMFSNKLIALVIGGCIYLVHWYVYETLNKSEEVIKKYNKQTKIKKSKLLFKRNLIYLYLFGSIIMVIFLGIYASTI